MNLTKFTLIVSPPGNFTLKVPNKDTISGGMVDPAHPQLRIYKFDHTERFYICLEDHVMREVVGDEFQQVLNMVANCIRGVNLEEAELIASIVNPQINAEGQGPLQRLEKAIAIMKAYIGDEGSVSDKTGVSDKAKRAIPRSTSAPMI